MADRAFPVLCAADVGGLASFYERLGFRRVFQMPEEGEPGYVGMQRGSSELAVGDGANRVDQYGLEPGSAPRFELFVYVDDVDATMSTLGAPVLRDAEDMPWGERVGCVADPEGNPVSLAAPLS